MIGAWIRSCRLEFSMTQLELGHMIGASFAEVAGWEADRQMPTDEIVALIAACFERARGAKGAAVGPTAETGERSRTPMWTGRVTAKKNEFVLVRTGAPGAVQEFIGKFQGGRGPRVEVEVFRSPIPPETDTLKLYGFQIEAHALAKQTPVYWKNGAKWRFGRVLSGGGSEQVEVQFPNRSVEFVSREELFVRAPANDDDPTRLLAQQVTSSPNFTSARNLLNQFVTSQRVTYKGLTALATARIELHRHQVAAVRRILSDPVHRYLLADEVGLGKTIEAGLLISQHLIDEGECASVLILAPDALVLQWRGELAASFGLNGDPRVRICPFHRLDEADFPCDDGPEPTLVVIDEAHRSAAWAFPSDRRDAEIDPASGTVRYSRLKVLAQCPKLLLLSGTPVLHHEDGFLAMLHLLDPAAYDLDDREGFKQRVAARAPVAEALAVLHSDFQVDFLAPALQRLAEETAGDDEIGPRIQSVHSTIDGPSALANDAVEELRTYLVERYRLHHRIVRTHRENPVIVQDLPTRRGLTELATGEDAIRLVAADRLEDWRNKVVDHGFERTGSAGNVFAVFVAASLSHPSRLIDAFETRAEELYAHDQKPVFCDEGEWLDAAASDIRATMEEVPDERMSALVRHLQSPDFANGRVVILTDTVKSADTIEFRLNSVGKLAPRLVRFRADDPNAVARFEAGKQAILVCDRSAEEGLNLQRKAAKILFYDVVYEIGRMEQRIGRFDRLEGMRNLHFYAFSPTGAYEAGWVRLLRDTLRVFDRSVARLQYVLAAAMQAFRSELLELGPEEAFEAIADRFLDPKKGLEAILRQLRRQEALDATAWRDDELGEFCEGIAVARETAHTEAGPAVEGWLGEVQFECVRAPNGGRQYFHWDADKGHNTLVPWPEMLRTLDRWVDRSQCSRRYASGYLHQKLAFGPFVYDPADSLENTSLLGLGHPFFDFVTRSMEQDDRSKSWALWRLYAGAKGVQVYLRFAIVIEADLDPVMPIAEEWKTHRSIRRRADEVFPVELRTCWIDLDGAQVNDTLILRELNRDYDKRTDRNLNADRWMRANERLPVGDWGERVTALRTTIVNGILQDIALKSKCAAAASLLDQNEQFTLRTLRSRAAHAPKSEREAIGRAMAFERSFASALRVGVMNPSVRIDNVGAIVLASEALE